MSFGVFRGGAELTSLLVVVESSQPPAAESMSPR